MEITTNEAVKLLGMSQAAFYKWQSRGLIPKKLRGTRKTGCVYDRRSIVDSLQGIEAARARAEADRIYKLKNKQRKPTTIGFNDAFSLMRAKT